ncbi:MAG: glycosyltransferase family 2 protein [bacterium]|nr:glycosyltransferase family 2 protein [bacterium]
MLLSIIIPTLNEEEYIGKTLSCIINHQTDYLSEIIVVDSGSTDNTVSVAEKLGVSVYKHPELKGRKYAILNKGASYAKGEVLAFLDADTIVPKAFDQLICQTLSNSQIVGGAFHMKFDHASIFLRIIEKLNHWRYFITQEYYGDQFVFCRSEIFKKVQGYPKLEILESAYFCKSISKHGKLKLVKPGVTTSSRRFREGRGGPFGVFLHDAKIVFLDKVGKDTNRYGKAYWKLNELKN